MPGPAAGRRHVGDPDATMDPALADQMLKFAQCMRDHGVDFPDPAVLGRRCMDPGRRRRGRRHRPHLEVFQDAQEACAKELPRRRAVRRGRVSSGVDRPRHRGQAVRGSLIAGAGLVLVVAAGAVGVASGRSGLVGGGAATPSPSAASAADLTTATVERRTMETAADLTGSLAYEASRPVAAGSAGTVTRCPRRDRSRAGRRPLRARRARPPAAPLRRSPAVAAPGPEGLRRRGRAPTGAEPQGHGVCPQGHEGEPPLGREDDGRGQALAEGDRPQAGRHARRGRPRVPPGAVRVASHEAEVGPPWRPAHGPRDHHGHAHRDAGPVRQPPGPRRARRGRHHRPARRLRRPGHVRSIGRVATAGENGARPPSRSPSTSTPGRTCPTSTPRR